LTFRSLNQVHGTIIARDVGHQEPLAPIEADAHLSAQMNLALCIRTADCLPLLAVDLRTGRFGAAHAGWRGLAAGLPRLFVQQFLQLGSRPGDLCLFVGPHIRKASFDIKDDALSILMRAADATTRVCSPSQVYDQKSQTFDLLELLRCQTADFGLKSFESLAFDTKLDTRFESHRRNRGSASRQNSFVARLSLPKE
jgi:hypothetical protein